MKKGKDRDDTLLESGTNRIEATKFSVFRESCGINVAKVQEIITGDRVKSMPHAHPAVEGIFESRDTLVAVINLVFYLSGVRPGNNVRDLLIVTNLNKMTVAFRVQSTEGISYISRSDIQEPDKTISNGDEGVATGIAQYGNQLVTILDLEKIVAKIAPEIMIQISEIEKLGDRPICDCPIVIAEDSILLRRMIDDALERADFTHIINFNNGQEVWDYLQTVKNDPDLYEKVNLVITDIEMPKMDGHRLTKLIKENLRLRRIPIVISSSLIDKQMRKKGKELGADEQLVKPKIGYFVSILDELLRKFDPGRARAQDHEKKQELCDDIPDYCVSCISMEQSLQG